MELQLQQVPPSSMQVEGQGRERAEFSGTLNARSLACVRVAACGAPIRPRWRRWKGPIEWMAGADFESGSSDYRPASTGEVALSKAHVMTNLKTYRCVAFGPCALAAALLTSAWYAPLARGAAIQFFDSSQTATLTDTAPTSDTISCNGYLFAYTRDKLFTGGLSGGPIGRPVRVNWPGGVEAQAVTTPPPGGTDHKARLVIQRTDGGVFDLKSFTAKLLANTAGAGADIEIMPQLDGEDGFNDPLYFAASGFYGSTFSYDTSPNVWGSTAMLAGFDKYTVTLYVDFALTALSLETTAPPLSGDFSSNGVVTGDDFLHWQRGDSPQPFSYSDLVAWQAAYGVSAAGQAAAVAVPEPPTVALVLTTASMPCYATWRRRAPGSLRHDAR
ncbi:MAG: hypothetical protein CMJ58_23490 [Planctomycetaceae bacterium]|nr:hypothetical protein [Planctomycetaceae bacterium]